MKNLIESGKRKWFLMRSAYLKDILMFLKYGKHAPRTSELLWISPKDCKKAVLNTGNNNVRKLSGKVVSHELWNSMKIVDVEELPKIKYCRRHWEENLSWEESGAIEFLMEQIHSKGSVDNCKSLEEVIHRFNRLDVFFDTMKTKRKFRTRKELNKDNFREKQGILIHLGPEGEPYFGGGGNHRFAIAKILNIKFPAEIGLVHESALKFINKFRQN